MNKEIAMRWVKALRSKKYKQGKHALCRVDSRGGCKYCCLGVLTELYQEHRKRNKQKVIPTTVGMTTHGKPIRVRKYGRESDVLPVAVRKWAGVRSSTGFHYNDIDNFVSLADMNDTGKSFDKIANFIAKNYKEL